MDLSTTYLGLRLPHPLIVGAGPLADELDRVRVLEDAGASLIVLRSLYEEEITGEQMEAFFSYDSYNESFAEAANFSPEPQLALGPDEYLEHLRKVKNAVGIPVMASLNGVTPGGWLSFARQIEQAGAKLVAAGRLVHLLGEVGPVSKIGRVMRHGRAWSPRSRPARMTLRSPAGRRVPDA